LFHFGEQGGAVVITRACGTMNARGSTALVAIDLDLGVVDEGKAGIAAGVSSERI